VTDRSPRYLAWVHGFESCVCWASDVEPWPEDDGCTRLPVPGIVAHHVRMGNRAGMSQKPSDFFTVPLTDLEHKRLHHYGEAEFWAKVGVDPRRVMRTLLIWWMKEQRKAIPEDHPAAVAVCKLTLEIAG
jgi:hypothetical protein